MHTHTHRLTQSVTQSSIQPPSTQYIVLENMNNQAQLRDLTDEVNRLDQEFRALPYFSSQESITLTVALRKNTLDELCIDMCKSSRQKERVSVMNLTSQIEYLFRGRCKKFHLSISAWKRSSDNFLNFQITEEKLLTSTDVVNARCTVRPISPMDDGSREELARCIREIGPCVIERKRDKAKNYILFIAVEIQPSPCPRAFELMKQRCEARKRLKAFKVAHASAAGSTPLV